MNVYTFLLVWLNANVAIGKRRSLLFKRIPMSSGMDGLGCPLDLYDTGISRGWRIHSDTGECDPLEESWFSNQTQEENYSYLKLWVTEPLFEPTNKVTYSFPYRLVVGSSIVAYMRIGIGYSLSEKFNIDIGKSNGLCFHMGTRDRRVAFNHVHKGKWGYEVLKKNPFIKNKTYKIRIRVTKTGFSIYSNDGASPFYVFRHRVAVSTCTHVLFNCLSRYVKFEKLQVVQPM